jgi:hypothetical protein
MNDQTKQPDETDKPEDEQDVEGHSLLYEQARTVMRDRERDMQKHARDARMLQERKDQKR